MWPSSLPPPQFFLPPFQQTKIKGASGESEGGRERGGERDWKELGKEERAEEPQEDEEKAL